MNLLESCHNYIEWANRNEEKANELTYELCFEYAINSEMPESKRDKLIELLKQAK